MKILACGSRDWCNVLTIRNAFESFPLGTLIVHGGARGADTIIDKVARVLGFTVRVYPADWAKDGKAAGPIRNSRMLSEEHPDKDGVNIDRCLAFSTHVETSKGTLDMVRKAHGKGIPVVVYNGTLVTTFAV
jgi:hypothetical protein